MAIIKNLELPVCEQVVAALQNALGDRLIAVVLFGSRARGEVAPRSDWDFLVIAEDLPERVRRAAPGGLSLASSKFAPRAGNLRRILAETERQVIVEALRSAGGNKAKAARILGIHRTSLYEKMKTHGLDPDAENDFSH